MGIRRYFKGILYVFVITALISGCSSQDNLAESSNRSESSMTQDSKGEVTNISDDELQSDAISIVTIPNNALDPFTPVIKNGAVYYPIEYSAGTETYKGYVSDNGEIFSEEVILQYMRDSYTRTLKLYDETGNISYTQENTPLGEGVQCVGDNGVFLWREVSAGIDNYSVLMGLKDCNGDWLFDPIDVYSITGVEFSGNSKFKYLGEGMFAAYDLSKNHGNSLVVFNSENGSYFYIEDVYAHNMEFYNGTMIYQQWDGGQSGGHKGDIYSVTRNGEITPLNTGGDLIAVNECGFLTDDAISFYSREGTLKWKFDQYEVAEDTEPVMYGSSVFINVIGADGKTYIVCIGEQGELSYEPVISSRSSINNLVGGHFVVEKEDNYINIIDLMSGSVYATIAAENEEPISYVTYTLNGKCNVIFTTTEGSSEYCIYDANGERIKLFIA